MHGVVNQSIEGLIIERFGKDKWEEILIAANCQNSTFYNNQNYPDSTTYDLAINASKILNIELNDILFEFGKYWVLTIAKQKYEVLLRSTGDDLFEFLIQLPNFHSRVMLYYPNIVPPEFKVNQLNANTIHLHYYSKRPSLFPFVSGILEGLKIFFATHCTVKMIESGEEKGYHKNVFELVF